MTFGGHFDVELLINAMRILYKMYNKFSFYSIVVQTVAPEGSSATEGLKDMYIKISKQADFWDNITSESLIGFGILSVGLAASDQPSDQE